MADEDQEVSEVEAKPKAKLKIIFVGLGLVVLLFLIGAGVYWFFGMNDTEEMSDAEADTMLSSDATAGEAEEFDEDRIEAIYHTLRPVFLTTFSANNRQRYMQVEITLVTRDKEVMAAFISHQPLIRNALVILFGNADYLELQTSEGKEDLRSAALKAVEAILVQETGVGGIEKILFTEFVMQ